MQSKFYQEENQTHAAPSESSFALSVRPDTFPPAPAELQNSMDAPVTTTPVEKPRATEPPPIMLDAVQFSWGCRSTKKFPKNAPSEALSEEVRRYFPNASIHFVSEESVFWKRRFKKGRFPPVYREQVYG